MYPSMLTWLWHVCLDSDTRQHDFAGECFLSVHIAAISFMFIRVLLARRALSLSLCILALSLSRALSLSHTLFLSAIGETLMFSMLSLYFSIQFSVDVKISSRCSPTHAHRFIDDIRMMRLFVTDLFWLALGALSTGYSFEMRKTVCEICGLDGTMRR